MAFKALIFIVQRCEENSKRTIANFREIAWDDIP